MKKLLSSLSVLFASAALFAAGFSRNRDVNRILPPRQA